MPTHLVNQELRRARVPILDALRKLDRIGQDGLADLLWEVHRGCDLDDLLVTPLHGAVALEQVHSVADGVREELHLDMARSLEEALDEDGAVTERGLSLTDRAFERGFEFRLFTDDAHAAPATAHGGLDDDCIEEKRVVSHRKRAYSLSTRLAWEAVFLDEKICVRIRFHGPWGAGNNRDADPHCWKEMG